MSHRNCPLQPFSQATSLSCALLLTIGCDSQVEGDYKGESLLDMAGVVALKISQGDTEMKPAICWHQLSEEPYSLALSSLPPELGLGSGAGASATERIFIQELESEGRFPAEFQVHAYIPPGEEAFSPERFTEFAIGELCAVKAEYNNPTQQVVHFGSIHCAPGLIEEPVRQGACEEVDVLITQDESRYYARQRSCEDINVASSCTENQLGDETLLQDSRFENVLGFATDLEVQYHKDPIKAGSYAAWRLGDITQDAEPGFYLLAPVSEQALEDHEQCLSDTAEYLWNTNGTPFGDEPFDLMAFRELMIERCPPYLQIVEEAEALKLSIEIGIEPQLLWISQLP